MLKIYQVYVNVVQKWQKNKKKKQCPRLYTVTQLKNFASMG